MRIDLCCIDFLEEANMVNRQKRNSVDVLFIQLMLVGKTKGAFAPDKGVRAILLCSPPASAKGLPLFK